MSRDFLPLVFFMNQFPPSPEYSRKTISNFFKNSRRYSQFKVHHRWQTMEQFSNCWKLKMNLKKNYLNANSTTQRCPKEIIKKISDWRFFPFATGVVDTGGNPWAANISANFRKNSKRPYWFNQGLGGKWFMKKTTSKKSHNTVPLICLIWLYDWVP